MQRIDSTESAKKRCKCPIQQENIFSVLISFYLDFSHLCFLGLCYIKNSSFLKSRHPTISRVYLSVTI